MKCKNCGNNSFEERYGGVPGGTYLVCMKCEEIALLDEEEPEESEETERIFEGSDI